MATPTPGPHSVGSDFGPVGTSLTSVSVLGVLLGVLCATAAGRWRKGTPSPLFGALLISLGTSLVLRAVLNLGIALRGEGPPGLVVSLEFVPVAVADLVALMVFVYAANEATSAEFEGKRVNETTRLLNKRSIDNEMGVVIRRAVALTVAFVVGNLVGIAVIAADPGGKIGGYDRQFRVCELFCSISSGVAAMSFFVYYALFYRRGFEMCARPGHLKRIIAWSLAGLIVRFAVNFTDYLSRWDSRDGIVIAVWVSYFVLFELGYVVDVLHFTREMHRAAEAQGEAIVVEARPFGLENPSSDWGIVSPGSSGPLSTGVAPEFQTPKKGAGGSSSHSININHDTNSSSNMNNNNMNNSNVYNSNMNSNSNIDVETSGSLSEAASTPTKATKFILPEAQRCRHCHERVIEIMLDPCMHVAVCANCAEFIDACPVCRVPVKDALRVQFC